MGSNAAVVLSSAQPKQQPSPEAAEVRRIGGEFIRDVRLMNYTPNKYFGGDPCYFEYRSMHYGREHDLRLMQYFLGIIRREAELSNELRMLGFTITEAETENYFQVRIEFDSTAMGQLDRLEEFRLKLEAAFLHSLEHGSHVFDSF